MQPRMMSQMVRPAQAESTRVAVVTMYKTRLCRNWEHTGTCMYGPKCQFAHGYNDLQPHAAPAHGHQCQGHQHQHYHNAVPEPEPHQQQMYQGYRIYRSEQPTPMQQQRNVAGHPLRVPESPRPAAPIDATPLPPPAARRVVVPCALDVEPILQDKRGVRSPHAHPKDEEDEAIARTISVLKELNLTY